MEFKELVAQRRSVRKFKPEAVNKEELLEIIRTASQAPSAGNDQMWSFIVITNEQAKKDMADIVTKNLEQLAIATQQSAEQVKPSVKSATFFVKAPAVIAVTTRVYRSKIDVMLQKKGLTDQEIDILRARPDLQSIGAAVQTLHLAACEKGYGTCWMTGPCVARPELEEYLGITYPVSLAALIPIGKAEIVPASRGRKPVEEVVKFLE